MPIPATPEEITLEWCNSTFGSQLKGTLKSVKVEPLKTEVTGATAKDYQATVEYSADRDPADPVGLYIKLGAANSHAAGFYKTELWFYNKVAERLSDVPLPRVLSAQIDDATGQFILVEENLVAAGYSVGNFLEKADYGRVELLVKAVANLHKQWLGRKDEVKELNDTGKSYYGDDGSFDDWLERMTAGKEYFEKLYGDGEKSEAEQLGVANLPKDKAVVDKAFKVLADKDSAKKIFDRYWAIPKSFCHGDFRPENALFSADNTSLKLIDFQALNWGPCLRDVAYCVTFGLDLDQIRAGKEKELLQMYHGAVGIPDYSFEQCWGDYQVARLFVLAQLMLPGAQFRAIAKMMIPPKGSRQWKVVEKMVSVAIPLFELLDFEKMVA
eukprot:TRINITY_DN68442_c0_g1_i1.p1 TRINITY_DN68442_c0_g1~~TRINITY_DN68442_c0_g1_i1.p1  ORF type:complete len:384 (+),score=65.60 TRINITY_DN68442_c0_g1_i1:81-1232(+)